MLGHTLQYPRRCGFFVYKSKMEKAFSTCAMFAKSCASSIQTGDCHSSTLGGTCRTGNEGAVRARLLICRSSGKRRFWCTDVFPSLGILSPLGLRPGKYNPAMASFVSREIQRAEQPFRAGAKRHIARLHAIHRI